MSLSVSNSLPVSNYSVKVISEANGSVFNPQTNSRIRLTIPSSVGMVDMKSSYLQFKFRVVPPAISVDATPANRRDCYDMVLSNDQGIEQIFKNLRVSIDNKPVEEIQNYNVLHKFKKDYSEDNAQKSLDSIFDKAIQKNDGAGYYCRVLNNATPEASYNEPTKHIAKLGCSGVLSLNVGLPVLATGKVDIELELEDSAKVLAHPYATRNIVCRGTTSGGGVLTSLTIDPTDFTTRYDRHGYSNADTASPDSNPFAVGNTIGFSGTLAGGAVVGSTRRLITGSSIVGNLITLTFTATGDLGENTSLFTGALNADMYTDENGTGRTGRHTYEVSEVEYVVRSIDMPPPYLNSLQKRIQQNAFMMDIPTYTSYLGTLQANIPRQSINVPAFSSRVKSVLTVPLNSAQTDYDFNRRGRLDGIRNYQAQIGTRREPNRAIDMTNTTATTHQYASQEHLHELKKLLTANGIGLRSLKEHTNNFVLCRSLSAMGGSEDLSAKGYRWDIEYTGNPVAKNMFSFVYHTKRIEITPSGLAIMD